MRLTYLVTLCALLAFSGSSAFAQEHGHSQASSGPEPVLSVADFDGSGEVNDRDLRLVRAQVESGEYIAFFDRNADGVLNARDIELTQSEAGMQSEYVDQELAMAFHNTKQYRDQKTAIASGFGPFTQSFAGHGQHWAKHPNAGLVGYSFQPGQPVGLNYDEEGRLWGVFYYVGPSPTRPDGTKYPPRHELRPLMESPEGFTGEKDHWHFHSGACFQGLNYENPTLDASEINLRLGLSPKECLPEISGAGDLAFVTENVRWTPKFYMVHAWLYELNPNGTFGETHPRLAQDAPSLEASRPHGKVDPVEPHPDYPFKGGTLCAWLAEGGMEPDFCQR